MLTDLINLFRKRWPEMMLVVGFSVFAVFLLERYKAIVITVAKSSSNSDFISNLSETAAFWYSLGAMFFYMMWTMLFLGFLASLIVICQTPQEPAVLLKIGRRFFWRIMRFSIIYGSLWVILRASLYYIVKSLFFPSLAIELMPFWVLELCSIPPCIILAKPLILVPCIMIVRNCMLLEASAEISQYEILKAKALLAIFISAVTLDRLFSILLLYIDYERVFFDVLVAIKGCLMGALILLMGLCGVWLVNGGKFGKNEKAELELSEAI